MKAAGKHLAIVGTSAILLAAALSGTGRNEHPDDLAAIAKVASVHETGSAGELRAKYAAAYNKARTIKLAKINWCEACGRTSSQLHKIGGHLETHHVISVEKIWMQHLDDGLIGDPDNLIVLCRTKGGGCHFLVGHDPDGPGPAKPNFKMSNPNVRRDAARQLAKTKQAI